MKKTLPDQLVDYLKQHGDFVASGTLQRMEWPKYAYGEKRGLHTPRSVVRRLEELVEEGKLVVEYRKNHAWYSSKEKETYPKRYYIGAKVFEVQNKEEEEKVRTLQTQGAVGSLTKTSSC